MYWRAQSESALIVLIMSCSIDVASESSDWLWGGSRPHPLVTRENKHSFYPEFVPHTIVLTHLHTLHNMQRFLEVPYPLMNLDEYCEASMMGWMVRVRLCSMGVVKGE